MQIDYKAFVDRMINRYEGGYGWDKSDPGGPTKYGITCYDLAEHRGQRMTSMSAWAPLVHDMTLDEAEAIYATKYATAVDFNDLPAGVDCTMFDYAVNSGYSRAALVACHLVGGGFEQHPSHTVTPGLLDAIKAKDPKWFIGAMNDERLHFMHQIRGGSAWNEYGKGWGARVSDLRTYSLALVTGTVAAPAPDLSKVPTPKATHVAVPSSNTATSGKIIATGTAAGSAHASGVPLVYIIGGVAVAAAAAIGWEIYKQHKANIANNMVVLPAVGVAHA